MSDGLNEIFKNNTEIKPQKLDVELALKLSKIVHDKCKGVPHDIGITLAMAVGDNKEELLNQIDTAEEEARNSDIGLIGKKSG